MNGNTDNTSMRPEGEGRERRSYPFEHKQERRLYPFERKNESGIKDGDEKSGAPRGKGRRGGNSSLSMVRHSGKSAPQRRSGRTSDNAGRRSGSGTFGRPGREQAFGGRSGEKYRRTESFSGDFSEPMKLKVLQNTEIGCFLELREGEKVLLPFSEQTERPEEGSLVTVRLFLDKGDRVTATMRKPFLSVGETGVLRVTDVTRIGVFLDNGVPKDVLLPFSEQIESPRVGQEVLVHIYKDKSGRTAATMRVYKYLSPAKGYKEGDRAEAFVYEINQKLGIFVAVDNKYFGLIPPSEIYRKLSYGDRVNVRITKVRPDGKLDLSLREKSYISINEDAEKVLEEIKRNGGELPYADRADAAMIEDIYGMSKNQFKRALGHLYRERKVEIDRENDMVRLL